MHRLTPIARPFKSAPANKNLRPRSTNPSKPCVVELNIVPAPTNHHTDASMIGWMTWPCTSVSRRAMPL